MIDNNDYTDICNFCGFRPQYCPGEHYLFNQETATLNENVREELDEKKQQNDLDSDVVKDVQNIKPPVRRIVDRFQGMKGRI